MAFGRWPKARARRWERGLALLLVFGLWLRAETAWADVELAPAPDGHIGTYLVVGPLSQGTDINSHADALTPEYGKPARPIPGAWQLLYTNSGALDLADKLRSMRPGTRAVVAGVLKLASSFDGFLLLSVDGGASVFLDGKRVWDQPESGLRGHSLATIPLTLGAGSHRVVLSLEHPGKHWALETRWLSRQDLRPPENMRWVLPKTNQAIESVLRGRLPHTQVATDIDETGFRYRVSVSFPRGALADEARRVSVSTGFPHKQRREYDLGSIKVNAHGAQQLAATLPAVSVEDLPPGTHYDTVTVHLEGQRYAHRLAVSREALELVHLMREQEARLANNGDLPEELRNIALATLMYDLDTMRKAANTGQPFELNNAISKLSRSLQQLDKNPAFPLTPGIHELAHLSELDGKPQSFWLHVPEGFDARDTQRYPLVLALHGYNGSPQGITQAFLDTRSSQPKAGVDGFVVAPEAHGNSFYRGPGEFEAMAVLSLVRRLYPIDPQRIAVTGVSMGGTGAAHLALRYPDTFSAAAPLCGYHSYFIRRDTRNHKLYPWEVSRMHYWSTSSWADNGRHIPMFVAHGTRDYPLENSRVLVRAYQERGFPLQQEWPDIGHSVWTISYKGARLWPWLSQKVRSTNPSSVGVYTHSLRYAHQHWVNIEQFSGFDRAAQLKAEQIAAADFKVTTENVRRFELTPVTGAADSRVDVDGDIFQVPAGDRLRFEKLQGWQRIGATAGSTTSAAPGMKQPGLEGPIRDIFMGKVAFVYGTLSSHTWRANREVAELFGRYHQGLTLTYPVLSDRQATSALAASHALVLVGTPDDHLLLRRYSERLPIRVRGDSIRVGSSEFRGSGLGTSYIFPNPDHPQRYILVISGTDIGGVFQALSLPKLLPDFVVYDHSLRPAATEQVLGNAKVLTAGYFTPHWSLPDSANR